MVGGDYFDVTQVNQEALRHIRRNMQMVFQDPSSSLNPRMTLLDIVGEPLLVHGMNNRQERQDRVAELLKLVGMILNRRMKRLVITHQDRLLRFGAELVFALCELQGIEIVIIHQGERPSFEEELAQDVLEIITVFSARLYGSRSKKHRKL